MKAVDIFVGRKGKAMPERKFGIFFEDLNHGADGGLYGELVQNRSFEFDAEDNPKYNALTAWEAAERGDSMVMFHTETASPIHPDNPHYLVLEGTRIDSPSGIRNMGYNSGMPVEKEKVYRFSCFMRLRPQGGKREKTEITAQKTGVQEQAAFRAAGQKLAIRLEDAAGEKVYAEGEVRALTDEWTKYECRLTASDTDYSGRLAILLEEPGCVELDMISLFPEDTFKGRENGMRNDLAQMLADLKPGFVRFPGGCLVHVGSLCAEDRSSIYRWKNTVRPVEERPSKRNHMWQYNQTLGMGFYEMFLLCEDLGAEPMPVISAGYDPHFLRKASKENMQEWMDEALDLIEFANGGADTKWGSIRVKMGHPESFRMKYLTIGNEEVGEGYFKNYEIIARAVREKYPEIKLINSAIIGSFRGKVEDGADQAIRTGTDYVDIHNYSQPEWFLVNGDVYTDCPEGVKIYLGEYSTCDDSWRNALMEAAFLTEIEKAEKIGFACYAPLLNNVDYQNWHPDLIHFDNHRVYGTPSYYVQKLFMSNQGESLIDVQDNLNADGVVSRENGEASREESVGKKSTGNGQSLSGKIVFQSEGADVEIKDFRLTDLTTGNVKTVSDFSLAGQCREWNCGGSGTDHYEISFAFRKRNGGGYPASRGKCALSVFFAQENENNRILWSIDGWQRTTSLTGRYGSGRTHSPVSIKIGEEYCARIIVEGAVAKTYINGALCNEILCRKLELKELYYSVVRMGDGSIIVKMVNLLSEPKEVHLHLPEKRDCRVSVSSMKGYGAEERNSLEEPGRVSPKSYTDAVYDGNYCYCMGEKEVVVLRFDFVKGEG